MPDYKSINASYKVSNDGKTVTIKGKTYSKDAFMKRFFGLSADKGSGAPGSSFYGSNAVKRGMSGEATRELVQEPVKPKVASSPEAAKKRAEKKAQKAGLKMLNKAGLGQKLTEPKPAAGKTRIGGLGTGRGAISGLGGGGLMDVNR